MDFIYVLFQDYISDVKWIYVNENMLKFSLVRQCPGLQLDDYETIHVNYKKDNTEANLGMFISDTPGYR